MFSLLPAQVLFASTVLGVSMPHTIRLNQRMIHKQLKSPSHHAPAKHITKSKGISEPLQNLFVGTDLQWFGDIGFGTPPQTFGVVFDTSTFDIEIPGMISTFVNLNETKTIHFDRGGGLEPMVQPLLTDKISGLFLFNSSSQGPQSMDVLKVTDAMMLLGMPVPETTFYLITNQTFGFINNPYDGIVGLGFDPESRIFSALRHHGLQALFSLYLTPRHIGPAELTLGGIDETKLHGAEVLWAPILNPKNKRNAWSLSASRLTVNGQQLEQDLFAKQPIVFDSSTSNLIMSHKLATAMYAHISPHISFIEARGVFGIPCSEIPSISAEITFTFLSTAGQPFDLTIPSKELSVGPFLDNPSICQTLINSMDIEGCIIGGSLLKYYYTVWDVDHARMGFVHNEF